MERFEVNIVTQRLTTSGEWDGAPLEYELVGRYADEDVARVEAEKVAARTKRVPAEGVERFVRLADLNDHLYDEDLTCADAPPSAAREGLALDEDGRS